MKIFLDFDDVLFNTKRFSDAYRELYKSHGISEMDFDLSYSQARERSDMKLYEFDVHMDILTECYGIDPTQLEDDINRLLRSAKDYLFDDSLATMQKLSDAGHEIFVVSFGTPGWQDRKINSSGVCRYTTGCRVGEFNKADIIAGIVDTETQELFVFVDDRMSYINAAKKKLPWGQCILLQRPEGRYHDEQTDSADQETISLSEAFDFLDG